MKSPITTHVLDTALGHPASGIAITLYRQVEGTLLDPIATGITDADGRVTDLLSGKLTPGVYQLSFDVAAYFTKLGVESFYPKVDIQFDLKEPSEHYHVPLLLSPFGYSTYRGS
ncbi:hydroxyisourate hydrolase [Aeoliella sp. SH292]|uniref:hydroxyisourate hydrolase n=1 Tax=Aeoliella sp. SH292 TaxID=3454464 RepID=UPI003F9AA0E9